MRVFQDSLVRKVSGEEVVRVSSIDNKGMRGAEGDPI
jgi:hypothetical protein